ncbi:MAG: hypothetical protein EA339_05555 [Rhodobacteraceae bacterium]|nr:MAG: hypothetical protein EA339_05555 [Paracoccaceae bacterium]
MQRRASLPPARGKGENASYTKARVIAFSALLASQGKCLPLDDVPEIPPRPHPGETGPRCASASLLGPFRVIAQDGCDITPGSMLRQAILAVLICAPRQIKTRKSLQDLFWGDAPAARASANLRMAIYQLRRDLAPLGADMLVADRATVSLAPGRITARDGDWRDASFLEGLDLPMAGCAGFEEFLRDMRLSAPAEDSPAPHAPPAKSALSGLAPPHLALGLLPPLHVQLTRAELHAVDSFVDHVVSFLWHTTTMDVHDLRRADHPILPLPIESGRGASHWLQPAVEKNGRALRTRLQLMEACTRRVLWVSDPIDPQVPHSADRAHAVGELLVDRLASQGHSAGGADLFPISAVAALFSLDTSTILRTETQLERMLDDGPSAMLECLRAFAQVFKVHEGIGAATTFDAVRLCDVIASMRASDPLLPLCQSLAGYAMHMLSDDSDIAQLMVEAAYERNPHLAINLDHLAVLRLIRGDIDGAAEAVARCLRVGAFSPWRYTYEVTGAMVSMARGDFHQSLLHANQALFRRPKYLGALRYAMAGLALSGQSTDARRMMVRIQTLRPGYDLSDWADGLLRRAPTDLSQRLVQGLRQSDILH